jgi:multidrug resistance efflux pump
VSCSDCSSLSLRAESLQRRLDTAEADVAELEAENAGLRATVARQREQLLGLANQVTR